MEENPLARWRYRFVCCHTHFGIHQYLKSPALYITLLRDPLTRTLSNYSHIMAGKGMNFGGFLKDPKRRAMLENIQTKVLSGMYTGIDIEGHFYPIGDHSDEEVLHAAKQNLKKCLFGFSEDVGTFIQRLSSMTGIVPFPIHIPHFKNNPGRLKIRHLTPDEIIELRRLNILDQQLYNFAKSLKQPERLEDYYVYNDS